MPNCSVMWCKNRAEIQNKVVDHTTYHRFPKNLSTKQIWADATGRHKWIPTTHSTICSKHFPSTSFGKSKNGIRTYLLKSAIPTLHLPNNVDNKYNTTYDTCADEMKSVSHSDHNNVPLLSCRLCLNICKSEGLIDIFDNSCKEMRLQMKIHKIFTLLIKSSDSPKNVCHICIDKIETFYPFWLHVKKSQVKLSAENVKGESFDVSIINIKVENNEDGEETKFITSQVNCEDDTFKKEKQLNCEINKVPIELISNDVCHNIHNNSTINGSMKDKEPDDSKGLESIFDPSDFPTELVKNGKLLIKGKQLENILSRFYNLQCSLCPSMQKFKKIAKLLEHTKSFHGDKGYITCYCSTRLHNHRTLWLHMVQHLQPSAFQCPICKKTMTHLHSLKLHMQTHLPKEEKLHKCDKCDRCFSYVSSLINHKETHVPAEQRTHKCNDCGKVYNLKVSLYTHMRTHRPSNNANLLCSECGKTLKSKSDMNHHMLIHHDTTGKHTVQCKHCGLICKNRLYLRVHEKRHTGVRFTCQQCPYSTPWNKTLTEHVRVKHTDEKRYSCTVCGKCFKRITGLKQHMPQHTGEARYNCPYCSRTFMSSGNYSSHRKRMHPEEYDKEKSKKIKTIANIGESKVESSNLPQFSTHPVTIIQH